ncbi:Cilia- and flagella-associated protein 58 [Diplonema papillatum]|nr:Cilia- and flagella-associated protein 58 [Diplonema papillatum]
MVKADDEHFDRVQQQNAAFEQYERQFQEVLLDLEGDETLDVFRKEYETLHQSFLKLHDGEKRLVKKCIDLQTEIHTCQTKIKTAEDLSAGDKSTIETLRKEIAKAKTRLDQSAEKEVAAKENIKRLRMELKDLEKQVEKGVRGLVGHDTSLQTLVKVRDELQKECDAQATLLVAIQSEIQDYQKAMQHLTAEKEAQDEGIARINEVTQEKRDLLDKEKQRKDYWERELKVMKSELLQHHTQIGSNEEIIQQAQVAIQRLEEQLHNQKTATEQAIKEYEAINKRTQKYQHDLQQEVERTANMKNENQRLQGQLRAKEHEASQYRAEVTRLAQMRDGVRQRSKTLEAQRANVEHTRNNLTLDIQRMEAEIATGRRSCENDRKQIEDLTRERDILNKNYLKAQGDTQKQKDWTLIKENQKRNLEQEIRGYDKHAHKQRALVYQLEHEAAQYDKEGAEALAKHLKAVEEVKTLELRVDESQRAIHDTEHKLKQQQGLFEQVLNERNLYSKNLLELHADIDEMERKFEIMSRSVLQLKEEIQQKEKDLVHHNIQKSKLESSKRRYLLRKQKFVTLIDANARKVTSLAHEINKLNEIINEADTEKAKQKRDYENVMNERDILGAQLIKRNDELAHLYERIRIQQSTMNKGDVQYRDRLLELRQLKEKSQQLRNELNVIKSFISKIDHLKLQVNIKTNTLTKETAKVKALTDELQNPLNVHRWHKIEGSDPQTFEALQRIHSLQKQLIQKTEEVQQKESLINEKEKLYVELKTVLSRQPGPEVAEQLNVYKSNLSKKTSQMKAMQMSLQHFQDQVKRLQFQYDEVKSDYSSTMTGYFKQRKAGDREQERQEKISAMMGRTAPAGGGDRAQPYEGHKVQPLHGTLPAISTTDTADEHDPYNYNPTAAAAQAVVSAAEREPAASADGAEVDDEAAPAGEEPFSPSSQPEQADADADAAAEEASNADGSAHEEDAEAVDDD